MRGTSIALARLSRLSWGAHIVTCMVSPAARRTLAPRISAIHHADLVTGSADDLAAGALAEGLSFAGVNLDGRQLSAVTITECAFDGVSALETNLRSASFSDTTIGQLTAPVLTAPRSRLTDVSIERSRLGSVDMYDTRWRSVEISHSKLGFCNLRGSELVDVRFDSCVIEELDLGGAKLERVQFTDCRVGTLSLTDVTLSNVDLRGLDVRTIDGIGFLRGATIGDVQLSLLAPLLAGHLGIKVDA